MTQRTLVAAVQRLDAEVKALAESFPRLAHEVSQRLDAIEARVAELEAKRGRPPKDKTE